MNKKRKMPLWVMLIVILFCVCFGYIALRILNVAIIANIQHSLRVAVRKVMVDQTNNPIEYFSNITSIASLKLPCRSKPEVYNINNVRKKIVFQIITLQKIKFTFSPITPNGIALVANENDNKTRKHFWIFSKPTWITPYTFIVFDDFDRDILPDSEISWYYQCRLKDLSKEELEKEKKYRKEKGLPELK